MYALEPYTYSVWRRRARRWGVFFIKLGTFGLSRCGTLLASTYGMPSLSTLSTVSQSAVLLYPPPTAGLNTDCAFDLIAPLNFEDPYFEAFLGGGLAIVSMDIRGSGASYGTNR